MGRRELLHELGASRTGVVRYLTSQGGGRRGPGVLARWLSGGPIVVIDGLAAGLLLDPPGHPLDHTHMGSIVRGNLESEVQEALRRCLPRGGVLFDVGANLGFFSLLGGRLAGPSGRVVAFEPVAATAEAIRLSAALNGLAVDVVEAAVSDAPGSGSLLVVGESGWSRFASLGDHPDGRGEIAVKLVALDDLVASGTVPVPDVVKIDTEGAEPLVLAGMRAVMAAHHPAIVLECHDNRDEVVAVLRDAGYRVENIDSAVPVDEAPGDVHLLAVAA